MVGFRCRRRLTASRPVSGVDALRLGARWYDPATGRFISPDPLGFVDGPNPYLYVAGDPIQFIDPWGLCISAPPERNWFERLYFGTRNDYYTYRDFPMLRHKVAGKYGDIASEFILWSELGGPIIGRGVGWVSRPIARTVGKWGLYRAARLRWLRFGRGARRFRFWRWGKTPAPKSGLHVTSSSRQAQSVLEGIDPAYFNPKSRFGKGFYLAEEAGTAFSEVGPSATHAIRYNIDLSGAKVLDLTNPAAAAKWGYSGGPISSATQSIGASARTAGFNVIRFPSTKGVGSNFAIFSDFDAILTPQMVTPVLP